MLALLSQAHDASGAQAIPRLAETAEEAREIARVLGGASRLYIGDQAQERTAKAGDLRTARFVLFATHGFLGGEYIASDLPANIRANPEVRVAYLGEGP